MQGKVEILSLNALRFALRAPYRIRPHIFFQEPKDACSWFELVAVLTQRKWALEERESRGVASANFIIISLRDRLNLEG
jgi:hypothetical protein